MTKGFKRTIMKLDDLSSEEQMKATINSVKSAAAATRVAAVMDVQDSTDSRGIDGVIVTSQQSAQSTDSTVQAGTESQVVNAAVDTPEVSSSDEHSVPLSDVQLLITQTIAATLQPIQEQLTQTQSRAEQLERDLNTRTIELETARRSTIAVENLSQLLGRAATPEQGGNVSMPNVNSSVATEKDYKGLIGEYMQERQMSGVTYGRTNAGKVIPVYNTTRVDQFVISNGLTDPSSSNYRRAMQELTEIGKTHGLFQGKRTITENEMKSAATAGDIPGGFLEILSSMMRVSRRPGLVFWQFAKTIHNFQAGYGELVDIPRARYPDTATSSTQRLLSGSGTFSRISDNNVTVQTGIAQLRLQEYGRGRPEAPPIAIPTFVSAYSMLELMPLLQRDLFYDYYNWEDIAIREQWRPTSQVFYNNGNNLVSNANQVATNGLLTRSFLGKLYTWFASNRVVPFPDGRYGLVVGPEAINQLKSDMDRYWQVPTEAELLALTNMMLLGYPNGENLQISGYVGEVQGFHIWTTNSFMVGSAGSEGVFSETNGASGTSIFREGYAFGADTAGRGIGGSGAQIVYDGNRDFGRMDRAIWLTYEGHAPLDVDPVGWNDTQAVPQELRVVRVRTADVLVA